jgi:F0F1-type ATP synthase membrane subunit b/b'
MTQLRSDVASLSIDLAGRVVEKNLDNATNRELVDNFIDQVGRSN